jgi:hypothetical protein
VDAADLITNFVENDSFIGQGLQPGFDRAGLPCDQSCDVLDTRTPSNNGTLNLAWNIPAHKTQSFTVTGVADPATATGTALTFDTWTKDQVRTRFHITSTGTTPNTTAATDTSDTQPDGAITSDAPPSTDAAVATTDTGASADWGATDETACRCWP